MTSRPYRIVYNGKQIGGRFASQGSASNALLLHAVNLRRYPNPAQWEVQEVSTCPSTRALIVGKSTRPLAVRPVSVKVQPIREQVEGGSLGALVATFDEVRQILGEPNTTDLDDPAKVDAAWAFQASDGRKGFVWCYCDHTATCTWWSITGDVSLLRELFADRLTIYQTEGATA